MQILLCRALLGQLWLPGMRMARGSGRAANEERPVAALNDGTADARRLTGRPKDALVRGVRPMSAAGQTRVWMGSAASAVREAVRPHRF